MADTSAECRVGWQNDEGTHTGHNEATACRRQHVVRDLREEFFHREAGFRTNGHVEPTYHMYSWQEMFPQRQSCPLFNQTSSQQKAAHRRQARRTEREKREKNLSLRLPEGGGMRERQWKGGGVQAQETSSVLQDLLLPPWS